MAKSTLRIPIPTNKPKEMLSLAEKIYAKHTELGDDSPLKLLNTNSWEDNGEKVAQAIAKNNEAEELARQMERVYRERDMLLAAITESIKGSRDLLLGVYRETPKTLGDYGFTVDDSKKKK